MRRHYAFESEDLSPAVKAQLEKVEEVVDEKCGSVEACDKMLDKIDKEQDKFNGCLKDMAGAAKDCQDGKCDTAEMAAKVSPKMVELKEVAKSIGVASEGETVTEAEVKDARDYLEGVEEIVEAKKDELEGGSGEKKSDDGDKKDDDTTECEDGECDASESAFEFISDGSIAMELFGNASREALSGMSDDDIVKKYVETKIAPANIADTGPEAKAKLKDAMDVFNKDYTTTTGMTLKMTTIAGVPLLMTRNGDKIVEIQFAVAGKKKFTSRGMSTMRAEVAKQRRRQFKADAKAAKKAGANDDAPASENFTDFIEACESFMIQQSAKDSAPYLFD